MEKISTNFSGMDLDTNPEKFNSNFYGEAYNVRIGSNIGIENSSIADNSKGSLEGIKNILGTLKNLYIADSEFKILALTRIRDHIAFIAEGTSTQAIYYIPEDSLNNTTAFTPFFSWNKTALTLTDKVQILGRYETPSIVKLYIADENSYIKSINLVGTPPTSVVEMEIYKPVSMSTTPSFTISDGGSIKCGNVCYAIQYYSLNGSVSNYIPVGPLIPLLKGTSTDTKTFMGGTAEETSSKKATITIPSLTVSNGLNYVKVVRVLYTLIENLPIISVVYDGAMPTTNLEVTDSGQVLESIAAEQFALNINPLGATTLEQKNNILFLGNILQNEYDVDYDARIRRYNSSRVAYTGDLNPWNDPTVTSYTTDNKYAYDSLGQTIGGDGVNGSYSFERKFIKIFDTSTKTCVDSENILNKTFQRGEIYGFSLVGFDEYMRPTFAKFIDDIKIPRFGDPEVVDTSLEALSPIMKDSSLSYSSEKYTALYPQFSFNNLPSTVKYVAIARTSREGGEGTISDMGIMCPLYKNSGATVMSASAASGTYSMAITSKSMPDYFEVVTPKILVNNSLPNFDRIEYTYNANFGGGTLDGVAEHYDFITFSDGGSDYTVEYFRLSQTPKFIKTTPIFDKKMYTFSNISAGQFNIGNGVVSTKAVDYGYPTRAGYKSRCMYVNFTDNVSVPPSSGNSSALMTCTLRKNTYPYGGYTQSAIEQRNWILSSNIIPVTNGSANIHTVGFGDTYVQMVPYSRVMWDANNSKFEKDFGNTSYLPFESQVLMKGVVGKNFDAYYTNNEDVSKQPYRLLQELKGVYIDYDNSNNIVATFTQENDLYSYNSAYSSDNKSKLYITKPSVYNTQNKFDTRVAYSSRKTNGEVIDSWSEFLPSNYKELDTSRGYLTKLINLNNTLFFVQEHGAGTLAVDERELINSTENAGALYLGTGGVLARYDYIYTNYGAKSIDSVDNTNNFIYFYDRVAGKFCRMNSQSAEILSDVKTCRTYFSKTLWDDKNISDYLIGCDNIRQQIYFKPLGTTNGIVFNELWDSFDSHTTIPFTKIFSTENVMYFNTSKTTGNIGKFLYSFSQNPSVDSVEGMDELEHSLPKNVTLIAPMAIPSRLDVLEWTSDVYSSNSSTGLVERMEVYKEKDLFLTFDENEDTPSPRYFNKKRYNRIYNVNTRERCKGNYFKIKYIGNSDIAKKANFTLNTFNMYFTPIVSK